MRHIQDVIVDGRKISPGQIWIHVTAKGATNVFIIKEVFNPDNIQVHGVALPFSLVDFKDMRMVRSLYSETERVQQLIVNEFITNDLEIPDQLSGPSIMFYVGVLIIAGVILFLLS
jgi:rRNA maturation protein Rpf1